MPSYGGRRRSLSLGRARMYSGSTRGSEVGRRGCGSKRWLRENVLPRHVISSQR